MKPRIVYASRTGNTRKIACAIGEALDQKAEAISEAGSAVETDLLFLGAAVYAIYDHGVSPEVKDFIKGIDPAKVGRVALFCTGFEEHAIGIMRGLLAKKGIEVSNETFFCRGRFILFNSGHPNKADLEAAREFALRVFAPSNSPKAH